MNDFSAYLQRIRSAQVYDVAIETPLEIAERLTERLGNTVLLKREDLQSVYSFKLRGAYNKIVRTPPEELERGVICSSAGNHAQGVALAAKRLGLRAVIVMPITTPRIKVEAVNRLGGEVLLEGAAYDEAYERALQIADEQQLTFVHAFDDPDVIAGQGTIGLEIDNQHPADIDAVFVPIGGGGLIAGIALYLKQVRPQTRIVGVEPSDSAGMSASLTAGEPVTLNHVGIFADGVAVRRVGDETFRICRELVDEIVLVSTDEICAATQDIFEDTRAVVEPAGALAIAGLKNYVDKYGTTDQTLVAILCGANVNFDRLRHIAERAALGEKREALLAVEIPEKRGSFLAFCKSIGARNVTEFNYRFGAGEIARIFVGIELEGGDEERKSLIRELRDAGYAVEDMTDNELAKLHVRHMVGGLVEGMTDERLYRFEFPERPGALLAFLAAVGSQWNISLFHYRNHGSDYGRVLAGIQVAPDELAEFERHLEDLGYPYWDESSNPAYKLFLGD